MSARSAPLYKMCVRPTVLFIGTATLMCLMILTTPYKVQAGKPTPPSPLPPVRYQVQLWTVPGAINLELRDTNNQMQTVGAAAVDLDNNGVSDSYHSFLYDPAIALGGGIDLNDIVAGIPAGWHIRKATAINEVGQITAYIAFGESVSTSNELQAVVIDMTTATPSLHVIPDRDFTVYSLAADINDFGDVTVMYRKADGTWGHYVYNVYNSNPVEAIVNLQVSADIDGLPRINNHGVIVGRLNSGNGYRTSLNGGFETFSGLRPIAINENDAFCGTASVTTSKPRGTALYAFVYDTSLNLNTIANSAIDLNESLDSVVFYYWLNHRTFGNLNIKDLLDPRDPNSSLIAPHCNTMTDRDPVTNFPILGGTATIGGISKGIHLIPVPFQ